MKMGGFRTDVPYAGASRRRPDDFQIADEFLGFLAPVRFDPADDHVHAGFLQALCLFEHRVGFADTRRVARKIFNFPRRLFSMSRRKSSGFNRVLAGNSMPQGNYFRSNWSSAKFEMPRPVA